MKLEVDSSEYTEYKSEYDSCFLLFDTTTKSTKDTIYISTHMFHNKGVILDYIDQSVGFGTIIESVFPWWIPVVVVLLIIAIGVAIFFFIKHRKKKLAKEEELDQLFVEHKTINERDNYF